MEICSKVFFDPLEIRFEVVDFFNRHFDEKYKYSGIETKTKIVYFVYRLSYLFLEFLIS